MARVVIALPTKAAIEGSLTDEGRKRKQPYRHWQREKADTPTAGTNQSSRTDGSRERRRQKEINSEAGRETKGKNLTSRGQTPPAPKARVVLQPLKTQKREGESPEREKRKRTEEEGNEKEATQQQSPPAADETRPVPDLREQAGEIEKSVLAFCLDPSKKVNKEQTVTIMRYFKDMRGIVEELLLHDSYLTGKLVQSTG